MSEIRIGRARVVRLWERPAERLLEGDVALAPLAVLGQLPEGVTVEKGVAAVAQRLVDRLVRNLKGRQNC